VGSKTLTANHQHSCFSLVDPTATAKSPVYQEDSPANTNFTIRLTGQATNVVSVSVQIDR